VDEHQLEQLYPFLKRTPAVTSVALRKNMIERFQQTIAKTQATVNTLQVAFAVIVIAIAALVSSLLVRHQCMRHQCDRLNLIAVLKIRE
jgi:hypothetical protein